MPHIKIKIHWSRYFDYCYRGRNNITIITVITGIIRRIAHCITINKSYLWYYQEGVELLQNNVPGQVIDFVEKYAIVAGPIWPRIIFALLIVLRAMSGTHSLFLVALHATSKHL